MVDRSPSGIRVRSWVPRFRSFRTSTSSSSGTKPPLAAQASTKLMVNTMTSENADAVHAAAQAAADLALELGMSDEKCVQFYNAVVLAASRVLDPVGALSIESDEGSGTAPSATSATRNQKAVARARRASGTSSVEAAEAAIGGGGGEGGRAMRNVVTKAVVAAHARARIHSTTASSIPAIAAVVEIESDDDDADEESSKSAQGSPLKNNSDTLQGTHFAKETPRSTGADVGADMEADMEAAISEHFLVACPLRDMGEVDNAVAEKAAAEKAYTVQAAAAKLWSVRLYKPTAADRMGVLLINATLLDPSKDPHMVVISHVAPGGLAAESGWISVGQGLVAVNGEHVSSHVEAAAALKAAVGDIELTMTASLVVEDLESKLMATQRHARASPRMKEKEAAKAAEATRKQRKESTSSSPTKAALELYERVKRDRRVREAAARAPAPKETNAPQPKLSNPPEASEPAEGMERVPAGHVSTTVQRSLMTLGKRAAKAAAAALTPKPTEEHRNDFLAAIRQREEREKENRVQHLAEMFARRIMKKDLSRGWTAWHSWWEEKISLRPIALRMMSPMEKAAAEKAAAEKAAAEKAAAEAAEAYRRSRTGGGVPAEAFLRAARERERRVQVESPVQAPPVAVHVSPVVVVEF